MALLKDVFAAQRAKAPLVLLGLITLHDGQQKIHKERKRFNVVACGRRWGKTRLGCYLACEQLAIANSLVGWFAPNYKYLSDAWDEILAILTRSDVVASSNKTDKIIRLTNGSLIEFWTLEDEDAGRSRRYHRVIVDEVAKQQGMSGRWDKAISPTLADFVGDAYFLSTPKGSTGFFYDIFQFGQSATEPEWASWQMPTSSNDYIPKEEIEAAERRSTPLGYRQEWLAEFVQPAGAVFDCFDSRIECEESGETNVILRSSLGDKSRYELHLGIDFGSANTACAAIWEDKQNPGTFICVGSYHAASDDESLHIERIRGGVGQELSAWGGAPSENAWRKRWAQAGMNVARPPVVGTNGVDVQIAILYRLIREKKLKICSDLTALISEILAYSYKIDGDDRTTDLIEDKATYHRLDALRYVMVAMGHGWELKRESKNARPKISSPQDIPLPPGVVRVSRA